MSVEWQYDGLNATAMYKGRRLRAVAQPGAGTGYGGWYGYVDDKFVDGADDMADLESMLTDHVDQPAPPYQPSIVRTVVPHRAFKPRR